MLENFVWFPDELSNQGFCPFQTACHLGEFSHQIDKNQDPGFPVGKECYGG